MVDDTQPGGGAAASICPWCSATYTGAPEACPSCGAALAEGPSTGEPVPGLTTIDAAAIVRSKDPVKKGRRGLLGWISGEYPDEVPTKADAEAIAPPDLAVRREILRLELEAEVANLQAEADAMKADVAVEGHADGVAAEDTAAAEAVIDEIEAVEAEIDEAEAEIEEAFDDAAAADAAAEDAVTASVAERTAPPPSSEPAPDVAADAEADRPV
jgi:hypothetical protein